MKFYLILALVQSPIFFLFGYFYFKKKKAIKCFDDIINSYGVQLSDQSKYELDRIIYNCKYIKLWRRQITGINLLGTRLLKDGNLLGGLNLSFFATGKFGRNDNETFTMFYIKGQNQDIVEDFSTNIFSYESIQIWPIEGGTLFIGGLLQTKEDVNCFIDKCRSLIPVS